MKPDEEKVEQAPELETSPQTPAPENTENQRESLPETQAGENDKPATSLDSIIDSLPNHPLQPLKKSKPWKLPLIVIASLGAALAAILLIVFAWYSTQVQPVDPSSSKLVKVVIEPGSGSRAIGEKLEEANVIKNKDVFYWYARLTGASSKLQSGAYRLSQADDMPTIIGHLQNGHTDTFRLTFLPGDTLSSHRQAIIDAGYRAEDVDKALTATYQHPLLKTKPKSADLEGYIYGETYEFATDATVGDILTKTFDEFYELVSANELTEKYKDQGLSLYEAITLASIIQREVTEPSDQRQVAQVFYKRLSSDMQLGSDVTYQYIADKTGQARDPGLDSPYNTRRYNGLPPGPIASPGEGSLLAVANPAKGDFLYFLSGDDDKTYFSRTNEGHERNIREHCQKKCEIL